MKSLAVICSRNPTSTLLNTIGGFNDLYPDFDIAVIDSNSETTSVYDTIREKYPYVNIYFAKNRNYELGAYKIAYELYPNYSVYMCLQDSIAPLKRFSFGGMGDNDVYHLPHHSGLDCLLSRYGHEGLSTMDGLLQNTEYYETFVRLLKGREAFALTTLNFFVMKNPLLKKLIETLPNLPKDKMGSCSYERILSICFMKNKWNMIPLNWTPCPNGQHSIGERKTPYAGNIDLSQEPVYFHKEYFNRA